ncbi:hypothetical protein ABTH68_19610, partial [Acinetobacter baumannii]
SGVAEAAPPAKLAKSAPADSRSAGAERLTTQDLKATPATQQFAMETLTSVDGMKYIRSIPLEELSTARIEEKMKSIDEEIER